MLRMKRREFLQHSSLAGAGVLAANQAWSLNRLEPIGDTLGDDYPYRDWEDLYRREFTWDKIGKAAHCINCVGNCAFDVYVKDGIVIREEQLAKYPRSTPMCLTRTRAAVKRTRSIPQPCTKATACVTR